MRYRRGRVMSPLSTVNRIDARPRRSSGGRIHSRALMYRPRAIGYEPSLPLPSLPGSGSASVLWLRLRMAQVVDVVLEIGDDVAPVASDEETPRPQQS